MCEQYHAIFNCQIINEKCFLFWNRRRDSMFEFYYAIHRKSMLFFLFLCSWKLFLDLKVKRCVVDKQQKLLCLSRSDSVISLLQWSRHWSRVHLHKQAIRVKLLHDNHKHKRRHYRAIIGTLDHTYIMAHTGHSRIAKSHKVIVKRWDRITLSMKNKTTTLTRWDNTR